MVLPNRTRSPQDSNAATPVSNASGSTGPEQATSATVSPARNGRGQVRRMEPPQYCNRTGGTSGVAKPNTRP